MIHEESIAPPSASYHHCAAWFPDKCDSFFIVLIACDSIADTPRAIHKIIPVFEEVLIRYYLTLFNNYVLKTV